MWNMYIWICLLLAFQSPSRGPRPVFSDLKVDGSSSFLKSFVKTVSFAMSICTTYNSSRSSYVPSFDGILPGLAGRSPTRQKTTWKKIILTWGVSDFWNIKDSNFFIEKICKNPGIIQIKNPRKNSNKKTYKNPDKKPHWFCQPWKPRI